MTEADLMRAVTDLAELLGYGWAHFRPAQTNRGWRTPVSGPLGKGWPDLTLVRVRDRRLIFAELKRAGAKPTADQAAVLAALGELMVEFPEIPEDLPDVPMRSYLGGVIEGVIEGMSKALKDGPKVTVAVWSPADLDSGAILELLR